MLFASPMHAGLLDLSPKNWTLRSETGDPGTLVADQGALILQFDATVTREYQFGQVRQRQAEYSLDLVQPVRLTPEQSRIFFTAQGMRQPYSRQDDSFVLYPVIRDESGEEFVYTPYPETFLGQSARWDIPPERWQRWRSSYFYANEAGGTATDIFQAEGGDGNNWPDGGLDFVGFKLLVRSSTDGKKLGGRIVLTEVALGGKIVPEYIPYIFAGNALKDQGSYQFSYELRNEFQEAPVAEGTETFVFDPADPLSASRRLSVPLGAAENYWIRHALTDSDGRNVATGTSRWQNEKDLGGKLAPADLSQPPAVGHLRVNPDAHTKGIYEQTDPFRVNVRVFAKGRAGDFKLHWELLAYNQGMYYKSYDTVIGDGTRTFTLPEGGQTDLVLDLPREADQDAYRLKLRLEQNGKTVDDFNYVLGFKTDFSRPLASRAGRKPDRQEVKKSTYYQTTFKHPSFNQPQSLEEDLAGFEEYLRESRQMSPKSNIMLDVANLEVLPGVYNFKALDRYLDLCADYGMKATVSFRHYDLFGEYNWQKYTRQRSFDNVEINQHNYGSFDFSDTRIADAWKDAARKVWLRYKEHPAFLGYYFYSVAGELSVIDKPWHGINVGHNQASATAFQKYLSDELKLSLQNVNDRWGTSYKSWEEIESPQPTFELGATPDLRMQWMDFCEFKKYQDERFWYEEIVRDVRGFDDHHVIICHNGVHIPTANYGLQDYSHNGGNHWKQHEKALQAAWEKGTGQITEPHNPHYWGQHGDPQERGWVLDHSVYCMLAQGGGGCANLGTYWLNRPPRLVDHYGGSFSYDRAEKFKPILNELVQTRLVMPSSKVGVLHDPATLFAKHRTIFHQRLQDLRRWFELLKTDGIAYSEMVLPNGEWSPDLETFKLLVPNALDEVMSRRNIDKLNDLVRAGAKMVLPANVGRYSADEPGEQFVLLRALGIEPPSGPFDTTGTNISATVDAENPVFPIGEKLAFYTTEQQKVESQGELVSNKASFWKWPYRWLPVSDYFGVFSGNMNTNGRVIARFANGAVALSLHEIGHGEVLVLWGTLDYKPELAEGFMARVAAWAGATAPADANPMPFMFELSPMDGRLRHYAVIYETVAGTHTQRIPNIPDGTYWVDDMVTDRRFGTYTAAELREHGMEINIDDTITPLRIVRFINVKDSITGNQWREKYRMPKGTNQ
jgi:hypothetical protein